METADFNKFVEEVKAKNDIVGVINRYVPLEKKGKTYWGRCPFHTEKTPSFAVNETGQFYHCFGCKAGGDVIKFISEIDSLNYMDSLAFLAERANKTKVPRALWEPVVLPGSLDSGCPSNPNYLSSL